MLYVQRVINVFNCFYVISFLLFYSLPASTATGEDRERDEDETPSKRQRQVVITTHVDLTE